MIADPTTPPLDDKVALLYYCLEHGKVSPDILKACKVVNYFNYVGISVDDSGTIVFKDSTLTDEQKKIVLVVGQ